MYYLPRGYDDIIRLHLKPTLGKIMLKDLNTIHIQSLYNNDKIKDKKLDNGKVIKGLSARTIEHINALLCTASNQAVKSGYIKKTYLRMLQN